jgi:hypothetical protein
MASVSGGKTVTTDLAPHLTATLLSTLMQTAPENLTVAELNQLGDAIARVKGGHTPDTTLGSLLV